MRSSLSKDADPNQVVIIEDLKRMSEKECVSLLKKIEVTHFVTFEELAFTKYKKFLELEERHGIIFDEAYRNDNGCKK